jgi:hypothetical protein
MDKENRQAIQTFYRTLLDSSGSITQQQVDFYTMVLKGDSLSRRSYAAKYLSNLEYIDPVVRALLLSADKLSKEDIAYIAGAAVAPKVAGILDKIAAWKIWPWNW